MKRFATKHFAPMLLVSLLAGGFALAQPPKPAEPSVEPKDAAAVRKSQEENARLFKEICRRLLELAVKLDKSDRSEDKDRAKTIRAALEVAEKAGADNQFRELIAGLSGKGTPQVQDLEKLIGKDEELSKTLLEMFNILMTDDETARLRAEIVKLEKFLKEAEEIKRRQELLRSKTDAKKGEPSKIAGDQKDLAAQTKDLSDRMGGNKPSGTSKPEEAKSDPKAADPKDGEKASEPKSDTQGSKSESKDGEPKAGSGDKPSKTGDPQADAPKSGDPKPGEVKSGDTKPTDAKDSKPSDGKSPGEGKGDSKPSDGAAGEGKGKGGQPPPGGSANSKPGGTNSGNAPPPPPPNPNASPGRKAVEEAYPHQKGAEEDANKDKRNDASKKMDKAVDALARAIEEMKKRLKQLREEEMLKLLANLEARCNRMLAMQIEVYENTKAIHGSVVRNEDRKPSTADIQKSQQQSLKEKEIVAEAEKALKLLETEGSAVAFARVLEEVMGDMRAVEVRLDKAYVDVDTQAIEESIISMLKEMVTALKKQQQEMNANKGNPPPPGNSKPNQKLIDQLAELKLIHALQSDVNKRTIVYGKKSESEQSNDPIIQSELRQLAIRQAKLQDMIQKIATEANQ